MFLAKNAIVRRKLTTVRKLVEGKSQKLKLKCIFKTWHLGFLQCLAIKEAYTSYETNLARKVIGCWKDAV